MMNAPQLNKSSQFFVCIGLVIGALVTAPATSLGLEMTDTAISDKIDDELRFDFAVNSNHIDVNTQLGIVTLTGSTDNLLAKERAARIARTVRGVKSVVNQLDVRPYIFKTDDVIQSAVERALANDPATEAYEVSVSVDNRVATLDGTVDSYQERELCSTIAKTVSGLKDVKDRIRVAYRSERPETEIEQEIKAKLKWDVLIDNGSVNVSVDKGGNVALSGVVGSAAEKKRAAREAWVTGVKSVDDSKLDVALWLRDDKLRGDKYVTKGTGELQKAVESALLEDPRVNSYNVHVEVLGSSITLRGVVDNLKAKRAAAQDAKNTVGVRYVTNRLKVRPSEDYADESIEGKVVTALKDNVFVDRYDLTVSVYNGVVHLYGAVDSYHEKREADDAASKVNGVVAVQNHLKVDSVSPYSFNPYVDDTDVTDFDWYDYQPQFTTKTDAQIKESVESELWWSPYVNADEVEVSVEDGTASLSGTVDSYAAKGAATDNAFEAGATWVNNDLIVQQ